MQGITPTVPQLPFLSSYGGFGPFGAGHRLKLDKLCIYGTYCKKYNTCKSLWTDSINVDGWIVE